MRLEISTLARLVSFLLGVAWAIVLVGISFSFLSYFRLSIVDAFLMSFFGAMPGLIMVVLLEYVLIGMQRYEEMKRQTKLLEEIVEQNRRDDLLRN